MSMNRTSVLLLEFGALPHENDVIEDARCQILLKNGRSVASEAHMIPILSSIVDHIAEEGLSHVMSFVLSNTYRVYRRKTEATAALQDFSNWSGGL